MRRMYSENQIIALIQQYAGGGGTKLYKHVISGIITTSFSTPLSIEIISLSNESITSFAGLQSKEHINITASTNSGIHYNVRFLTGVSQYSGKYFMNSIYKNYSSSSDTYHYTELTIQNITDVVTEL